MILNNEYLNLVEIARNKQLSISLEQYNQIRKLYKDIADELKMRANKAKNRSLSQGWLKDYKKVINIKLKEMDKILQSQIKNSIEKSAEASNAIQLDFFDLLNLKYGLNMKQTFRTMFSSVPSNVTAELVSGSFYKDGLGLSHRIWFNHNKVNGNIDYLIQKGIAEKKSAYALALDVAKYVNPEFKADWAWNKVYPKSNKKIDYCAQRLARTSISHSYTLSMLRGCEVNPFITKVRWHSVFAEGRTCELCEARDGRIFFLKDCPMDHPNGMCYQEPILDDSLEDIGSRLRDWIDGNTDTELDNWYDEYVNHTSSKKIQNIYIPNGKNSSIISNKKWLDADFPTQKKFEKHIEKHLSQYGDITPNDYLNKARKLLSSQLSNDVEGFVSEEGFLYKYRKSTNDFAIGRPDGKISTLFKPDLKLDYWKGEMEQHDPKKKV